MSGSKYPHEVPDGKPPDQLKNTERGITPVKIWVESLPEATIEMSEWHWVQHRFICHIKILVVHKWLMFPVCKKHKNSYPKDFW